MSAADQSCKVPGREVEEVRELDPDGRIVVHHRTVDTLGKMLRAGTITPEMHDAASDFQADFAIASLDPIRAAPILRVSGVGREPDLNERQIDARRRVHEAMQALGGISSPAGSCVWHVGGLAAQRARVGDAARLEWPPGAAGTGSGDSDRGAGDAGHALRLREGGMKLMVARCRQLNGLRATLNRTRWPFRSPHLRLKHRQKAASQ